MNTPTHAVLSVALLASGTRRERLAPAVVGAVVPDLPIFVLFAVATFVWHEPQTRTWGETYFEPGWQHAVDALHSFPILGIGLLLAAGVARRAPGSAARAVRVARWIGAALASALLHSAVDMLVHAEDAHHHLWPLSAWRFVSAVSYWDPRHYGLIFVPLECLAALGLLPLVWRGTSRRAARALLATMATVYAVGLALGVVRLARGPGDFPGSLQGTVTGRD